MTEAGERPVVAVTFAPVDDALRGALGELAELRSTAGMGDDERRQVLGRADVVLCFHFGREVPAGLGPELPARLVQLVSAGADHVPFAQLPRQAVLAANVGAYAEPMAEHVLAMALALLKRLPQNHAKLASGVWDQSLTRWLKGATCGIVGFGGIGRAVGRRMSALGAQVYAVNTTGTSDEPVAFAGTLDDLDTVLAASDVVVLSLPLTRRTRGLVSARELRLMKPDAVLVNVGRGALVDEAALYHHLRDNPGFSAAIDTWWDEPFRSGRFHVQHPFFDLPNVLGSPHNSGLAPGVLEEAVASAAANIGRFLRGETPIGVVRPEDYVGDAGGTGRPR
jgi:phosphoglycerate dehydrogenase-like enzyme